MKTYRSLLFLTLLTSLCSAQEPKTVIDTPAMPENPPETWLTYHLAHPEAEGTATAFDPNPAFFWKGRYHLHYIYKHQTGSVLAHVSSEDMVHWKWSKPHEMLPHDKDGKPMTDMSYFDPDLWIKDGIYYGLNGRNRRSSAVIMKSENLKDWDYIGELFHPDFDEEKLGVSKDEDVSCANMFKLGDKWVLLCISHKLGCRYYIGDFKDEQFLPEQHGMMNWAAWDFMAPESLLTPDGRRVMWAWCTPRVAPIQEFPREKNFYKLLQDKIQTGIQSLPRELSLSEDGKLLIKPLRELKKLRSDEKTLKDITVKSDTTHMLEGISGDAMELEIVIEAPAANAFGIKVLADQDGNKGFTISSGKGSKTLNVGYINPPFNDPDSYDAFNF